MAGVMWSVEIRSSAMRTSAMPVATLASTPSTALRPMRSFDSSGWSVEVSEPQSEKGCVGCTHTCANSNTAGSGGSQPSGSDESDMRRDM
eukprot:scaffold243996_cov40-Tisochrysis_lutea.AAC.6